MRTLINNSLFCLLAMVAATLCGCSDSIFDDEAQNDGGSIRLAADIEQLCSFQFLSWHLVLLVVCPEEKSGSVLRKTWRGTYDGTLAENPYLPDIISVDDAQD